MQIDPTSEIDDGEAIDAGAQGFERLGGGAPPEREFHMRGRHDGGDNAALGCGDDVHGEAGEVGEELELRVDVGGDDGVQFCPGTAGDADVDAEVFDPCKMRVRDCEVGEDVAVVYGVVEYLAGVE